MENEQKLKFVKWLSLHMKETTAKDRANTIVRILTQHTEIPFDHEKQLFQYIKKYIIGQDIRLQTLHNNVPPTDENEEDEDNNIYEHLTFTIRVKYPESVLKVYIISTQLCSRLLSRYMKSTMIVCVYK